MRCTPPPEDTSRPLPLPTLSSVPLPRGRPAQPLTPLPCRRSSVAKVNIFYQELNYRRVDETPVYSVSQPGTHGLGGAGAVAGQTPQGPAVGTCSPPPDARRCRSCCQPWAASGACGSAPRSSLCWSCCLTLWLWCCFGAAAGSAQLRGPSWGQPQGHPPRSQEPSSYPLTAGISTIRGALLASCPANPSRSSGRSLC